MTTIEEIPGDWPSRLDYVLNLMKGLDDARERMTPEEFAMHVKLHMKRIQKKVDGVFYIPSNTRKALPPPKIETFDIRPKKKPNTLGELPYIPTPKDAKTL